METNEYTVKCKRGIDDLESIYAFYFNDGGGGSSTNDISVYTSDGWWSYNSEFRNKGISPIDQEAINKYSKEIAIRNEQYIDSLYKKGKYGEEYEIKIDMVYNPLFDKPSDEFVSEIESSKIIFLDFNKNITDDTVKED